jgi:hypothetical protein
MASRLMAPGRPHGGDRAPLPPGTITSFPGRREACRAGGRRKSTATTRRLQSSGCAGPGPRWLAWKVSLARDGG